VLILYKVLLNVFLFIAHFVAQHNGMHNFKTIREIIDVNGKTRSYRR